MSCRTLVFLVVAFCGCESPRSSVHGKLTYQGKPVTDATIVFLASDNQCYQAYPKSDGSYEVNGLPRGKVKVSIQMNPPRVTETRGPPGSGVEPGRREMPEAMDDDARKMRGRPGAVPPESRIPPHFADPEQSGLDFELTEANQNVDLNLR